jgi:hypothetical protein
VVLGKKKFTIESLLGLCMLRDIKNSSCTIIERLKSFYQTVEFTVNPYKWGPSLQAIVADLPSSVQLFSHSNYYDILTDQVYYEEELAPQDTNMKITIGSQHEDLKTLQQTTPTPVVTATFPEDLGIVAVSTLMNRQQQENLNEMEEDENPSEVFESQVPPSSSTIITSAVPTVNRYRLNLIRHKFATSTELKTLQLFKAFAIAAMKTDKNLVFLPVDSSKQHLTPITSQKQVEALTSNQLRLYFSSWFKDQHHSISGFIHITSSLSPQELETKLPLAEWLQTYQYSIALCKSQDEEMSLIGALCYGSLFLYRDGLLHSITTHSSWIALNSTQEKPIVIDLIVKPFRCTGKSTDMIFIRVERSKKDLVRNFFLELYDGTSKKYPRGDMFFFIPVASKLEIDYTDTQHEKFLFNHMTYLGEEDCMAIAGLADLDTEIKLKDNSIITIRTLLKSLPASQGMSHSRLFQVVDPTPAHDCVLVLFQRSDKSFIEKRKFTLEAEILSRLASGQASVVFKDALEGIHFVGAYHKNKGKVIRVNNPTKVHQDFLRHADSLLSSPPKKRPNPSETTTHMRVAPFQPFSLNNVTYSGAVQAHTTHTRSIAVQPDGTRTTTTVQMSQTVMAVMETRFQVLETEQQNMKQRITGVENKAANISENIQAMMAHWKITPVSNYKRKPADDPEEEGEMEQAYRPVTLVQGQGDNCF